MAISISVCNFRGCASARIECDPIALVGGLNAAGNSIAQGVGAAVSGNALPIAGMRVNAAGLLVRTGSVTGSVEVSSHDGSCSAEWPAARGTTEGVPPQLSEYAVGLNSIVAMLPRDRMRVLAEYLHADPTREDFSAAVADLGLDAEAVRSILAVDRTKRMGWRGCCAARARRRRRTMARRDRRQLRVACCGVVRGLDLAELDEAPLVEDLHRAQSERDRALYSRSLFAAAASTAGGRRRAVPSPPGCPTARVVEDGRIQCRLSEGAAGARRAAASDQAGCVPLPALRTADRRQVKRRWWKRASRSPRRRHSIAWIWRSAARRSRERTAGSPTPTTIFSKPAAT